MAYPWFKVDTAGWIKGSIRIALTPEQRSVWIDLLALAADCRMRDGTLRFAEGKPMGRDYIANVLRIPLELLNTAIEACCDDRNVNDDRHRLEVWDDGTIEIVNWNRYQSIPFHQIRETPEERHLRIERQTRQYIRQYPDVAREALRHLKEGG